MLQKELLQKKIVDQTLTVISDSDMYYLVGYHEAVVDKQGKN